MGFEPTLEFPLNTLSKRAPSATRPSLRLGSLLQRKATNRIVNQFLLESFFLILWVDIFRRRLNLNAYQFYEHADKSLKLQPFVFVPLRRSSEAQQDSRDDMGGTTKSQIAIHPPFSASYYF